MGVPVNIVSQMPDVDPGATPVAYGNWPQTYLVVTRRATTMVTDPFSAGFCTLFRFEARVSGLPGSGEAAADQVKVSRKIKLKRTLTPDNAAACAHRFHRLRAHHASPSAASTKQ